MKKFFKYLFSFLLLVPIMFTVVACSGGSDPDSSSGGANNGESAGEKTYTVNFVETKRVDSPNGGEELKNILFTTHFNRGENVEIPTEEYLRENNKILYYPQERYSIDSWECIYSLNPITSTSFNDDFFNWVAEEESWSNTKITTFEVVARFTNKALPITYQLEGGENNPDNLSTAKSLDEIKAPTKQSYYFAGWTVSCDEGTGNSYDTPTRNIYGEVGLNCVLTAHWELNQIVFSGNANNGGDEMQTLSYNEGESIELPTTTTFTKTNCSLKGWSTTPYESDMISGDYVPKGGEVTLYPIWQSDNLLLNLEVCGYEKDTGDSIYGYSVYGYNQESQLTQAYIPSEFNGYKVLKVIINNCDKVKSVIFEDNGKNILTSSSGYYTNSNINFSYCANLKTLQIPITVKNVTFISHCDNIENFILHDDIEEITYSGGEALKSLTIPSKVTKLNLENLTGITSLIVPNSVTNLTLSNLTALENLSIPTVYQRVYSVYYDKYITMSLKGYLTGDFSNLKKLTITGFYEAEFTGIHAECPLEIFPNIEEVDVQSATNIFNSMFYNLKKLKTITLNENIDYIGWNAFVGCSALESITIPNNVTSFNADMFDGCSSLKEIKYNQNISVIPANFAKNCSSLQSFKFNCNVEVQESAFEGCSALTSFVNDSYITNISGNNAFKDTQISSINLSSLTLSSLPIGTFNNCSKLSTVTLPATVTTLGGSCFANCVSLTDLTQFYNVTDLHADCFINTGFKTVAFWTALNYVDSFVFANCANLANIDFTNYKLDRISWYMFYNCSKLTGDLVVPKSVTTLTGNCFDGTSYSTVSFAGDGDISIGSMSFANMKNLKTFTANGPSKMGTRVFKNSPNIENLTLSCGYVHYADTGVTGGVRKLSLSMLFDATDEFYEENSSLYNVVEVVNNFGDKDQIYVPNSIETITIKDAEETKGYKSSTLKTFVADSATKIVLTESFNDCPNLTTVTIPNLEKVEANAFENCASLVELLTSGTIVDVSFNAFTDCIKLKTIDLSKVTQIWNYAFYNCKELKSINLSSCQNIHDYAFSKSGVELATLFKEVSVSSYAFANCTELKTIDFSQANSVNLFQYAFQNCTGLTQVSLDNVKNSSGATFAGCSNIIDFALGETTNLGENSFEGLISVKKLEIPKTIILMGTVDLTLLTGLEEFVVNADELRLSWVTSCFKTQREGYNVFIGPSEKSYYPTSLKKFTINCNKIYEGINAKKYIPDCIDEFYLNIQDGEFFTTSNKLCVANSPTIHRIMINDQTYYNNFSVENCYLDTFEDVKTIYVSAEVMSTATENNALNQTLEDETLFSLFIQTDGVYRYTKVA